MHYLAGIAVVPWRGRRRPHLGRQFVAEIEDLAGGIQQRVIRPRRQPVLAAVNRPGKSQSVAAGDGPEIVVGEHIAPWCRRARSIRQMNDVFTGLDIEPAETVVEQQAFGPFRHGNGAVAGRHRRLEGFRRRNPRKCAVQFFVQAPAGQFQHNMRRGDNPLSGHAVHLVGPQQVDAAVPAQKALCIGFAQDGKDAFPQIILIGRKTGLKNHDIAKKPAPMPKPLRADEGFQQVQFAVLLGQQHQDRIIAGNSKPPQVGLPLPCNRVPFRHPAHRGW